MPVQFANFHHSYLNGNKKPVFVPSDEGRRIGLKIKSLVEHLYEFDPFYWHLRPGGHVGALHAHRNHTWFARIDLKNFFYSVRRQAVQRSLRRCGVLKHESFAKWSTVKNPYEDGGYALPYGFVQSPILSSLVLSESSLGTYLREASEEVTVGVYLDDISISTDDRDLLETAFAGVLNRVSESGFTVHADKTTSPAAAIQLFNCELRTRFSAVLESRQEEFRSVPRTAFSEAGFQAYCNSVALGNTVP